MRLIDVILGHLLSSMLIAVVVVVAVSVYDSDDDGHVPHGIVSNSVLVPWPGRIRPPSGQFLTTLAHSPVSFRTTRMHPTPWRNMHIVDDDRRRRRRRWRDDGHCDVVVAVVVVDP